jgi:predicted nucleic acid-binding protein
MNGAPFLVDVNVWLRDAQPSHAMHATASTALRALIASGAALHTVPQTMYEFWVVATRPAAVNGLGWTPAQADAEISRLQNTFTLLPETPDVYLQWRRLCAAYGVSGLPAHDARLVAAMKAHGLAHLLTFNTRHFRRFEAGENIAAIDPTTIQ